jgi:ribosomal protein S11
MVEHNDQRYLALQFVIAKWATDLQVRVEANSAFTGTWTQIDPNLAANVAAVQDNVPAFGLKTLTIRDVTPIYSGGPRRLMRLRVTKQ